MKKKDRKEIHHSLTQSAPIIKWKVYVGYASLVWIAFTFFKFDQKFGGSINPFFDFVGQWFDFSLFPFLKVLPGYLKSLSLACLVTLGATSWGGLIVWKFSDQDTPLPAKTVLSLLLGLIFLSLIMTAVGFLGFLKSSYLYLLLFSFVGLGAFISKKSLVEIWQVITTCRMTSLFDSPSKFILWILGGFVFMMAFVPELFYDCLVYHLGLPQMFINEGRIVDTPHVYFSRSPMLIHMLYTLAVGIDGSSLAKLMNLQFMLVGVLGSFVVCDALGWKKTAPWAPLIYLAIPIVQMNLWSTMVDSAMGGVFVLALYCLIRWQESDRKIFWTTLTALFSGAAFAIKYPGMMILAIMGALFFVLVVLRRNLKKDILLLFLFGFVAVSIVSPWLVRNYVWTGNPVYPILSSRFESRGMHKEKMDGEKGITKRSKPESIKEFVFYPWTQTMKEMSNFNFVGPMMLCLLPLLVLLGYKKPRVRIFAAATFGYFFMELQVLGEFRYIMPGFLPLGILLAGGINELDENSILCGGLIKTVILGLAVYHLSWIVDSAHSRYKPVPLLLGKQSRDDYSATLHNGLNLWPWNSIKQDLSKLPEPCRVYILGNEQVFGFPKKFWYSSVHDHTPLVLWANDSKDGNEVFEKMRSRGITHILLNIPEAMRLKSSNLYPWTKEGRDSFVQFANQHLTLINVKPIMTYPNSLFLFELREKVDAPHPFGNFGIYFQNIYDLAPR